MALKSILLKGNVGKTLTYPVPSVLNIREGEWQIGLSNVSFIYDSAEQHPSRIPRVILKITSNYVLTQDINERGEVITVPACLSVVRHGGNHGSSTTIGFKNRDYYNVNNAEKELIISFKTVDTDKFTTGSNVFLLVVFKRLR